MATENICQNCIHRVRFNGHNWGIYVCDISKVDKGKSEITFRMIGKNETCQLFESKINNTKYE